MKVYLSYLKRIVFITIICVCPIFAQPQASNSISGFVFDASNRQPVPEIHVELLDDVYSTLRRVRTDGSGRFFFGGISSGSFKVKVLPYGTNYLEEIQDATIINFRIGTSVTSDNVYLDFYLRLDKRKINIDNLGVGGTVYAQETPPDAENLYKKAVQNFQKPAEIEVGFENLKKAIEIFPEYYNALNKLGAEYIKRNQYSEAVPYLIKSINVNKRSFSSFYMLGVAAFNLKQIKEAIDAFRAATIINPKNVYAIVQYGMVLRINGSYKEAESALLKAVSISKDFSFPETHWQLALLYNKMERHTESAKELEIYLKLQPDSKNNKEIKELISKIKAKAAKKD